MEARFHELVAAKKGFLALYDEALNAGWGHEEIGLGIASLLENHTKKMGRKKRLGKMTGPTTDHNGD